MLIDQDSASLPKKRKTFLKTSLPYQKYAIQNGVELSLRNVFALANTNSRIPIQIIFDDQIVFVVGHYIVINSLSLKQQQIYIELESGFSQISCLATETLPDKKAFLAYTDTVSEVPYEATSVPHRKIFSFITPIKSKKEIIDTEIDHPKTMFRIRAVIIGVNFNDRHILTHFCAESFEVKQLELSERKYCYILCENEDKAQVIHIWNFEKDSHIVMIEMRQYVKRFCLNPINKSQVFF